MPYLPELNEGNQTRAMIDNFGGYNHNLKIGEGEWYEESNLTSEYYPMFANRRPRGIYTRAQDWLRGIIAKDALAWIDGDKLIYNGKVIEGITLNDEGPKQLVSMGAYLCIFPDGVYFNTAKDGDYGYMGARYESSGAITYTPCRVDGEEYVDFDVSADAPAEPVNGAYWMDSSGSVHVLKQYSSSSAMWIEIPTVYTKIYSFNIHTAFNAYDGVTISGVNYDAEDVVLKDQLHALNTSTTISAIGENYIVIAGILDERYTQTAGVVTVERKLPKLDFVCEANNRLWGCCYGLVDGKTVNEIYACKLGDFKNWNCFMGLSTDSYSASVGTDGEFTGCTAYLGSVLFFKENYIHRLSGSMPANYQLTTTACRGVQRGSERSLAIVNEILYYKSRSDVCAYDGSMPVGVSPQFGTDLYHDATAGAHGGKYYISMRGDSGWHLFVYDAQRGVWHREDDLHAIGFASWNDEIYIATQAEIIAANGTVGAAEKDVAWEATSGLIGYELVDHQYVSRFNIRMKLAEGAKCALAIEYDSSGVWIKQGVVYGHGTSSFVFPVIPQRCDHFRYRLRGEGDIRIYSIAKIIEQGSDA